MINRVGSDSSDSSPLVSIIIPVKNGLPTFLSVIEMVSRQKFNGGFEVIVIDSGSTDCSKEAIPLDDPRFRLIEIPSADFGHGKTRNLGVSISRGQFCAFLTHDAVPINESWLAELVRPLLEDPRVAGVFGRHVAHEGASPFTQWELQSHFAGLRQWPKVEITDAREYAGSQRLRQIYHFYSDNSSCLRRSIWETIPYPDVEFAEDQLWAKQVLEAGFIKAFAWDSVVAHSHEYSPWERLQRSYDEARAFRRLFGYILCNSRTHALIRALGITFRDTRLALRHGWLIRHPLATFKMPFQNFSRQIGHYLGSRSDLSERCVKFLSRDKQIQAK
jgi:glycosyltransferase involved in cell wall biosynthesis